MQGLTVAVLMGGASAEAEVSRNSAAQVSTGLQTAGHRAELVELNTDCAARLAALGPDVVFPALHGPPGEDGTVQGFLEIIGLPYVGSGVRGSALAMDKHVAKQIFRHNGLPVAEDLVIHQGEDLEAGAARVLADLGPAVVIKPLNQGSAIGVTPLPNGGDITGALATALTYGNCLVEPFIMGREITVGVLERNGTLEPHPVIEIQTGSDEWYDFNNRYTAGQSRHIMPAPLPDDVGERLQQIALSAHKALDLRDLSRADFIVTETHEITLLEVNTLPGMTPTSLYPEGAAALGLDFAALVDHLARQAHARAGL